MIAWREDSEAEGRDIRFAPYFEEFNPFVDYAPEWPFKRLPIIAGKASAAVSHIPIEELRRLGRRIEECIADQKQDYIQSETENYIDRIVKSGGWELRYAPDGAFPVTHSSVAWLLRNWPEEADMEPDYPREDDISDLDALEESMERDYLTLGGFSILANATSVYAIFTLMKVEEVLGAIGWRKGRRWIKSTDVDADTVAKAADVFAEAIEAAAEIEKELLRATLERHYAEGYVVKKPGPSRQELAHQARSNALKRSREARIAVSAQAKLWAREKWLALRDDYSGKRDFAGKEVVSTVGQLFKYPDGKPVEVSIDWVADNWLQGL